MTDSTDIIKELADHCVSFVALLPAPIYTFPVRVALILIPATLASRTAFELGSRTIGLQISVACLAVFFSALLPVDKLSLWLHRAGSVPCALVFVISVLTVAFIPMVLPRWLVSRYETQRKITRLIYRVLLVLLIANMLFAGIRTVFT